MSKSLGNYTFVGNKILVPDRKILVSSLPFKGDKKTEDSLCQASCFPTECGANS